MECLHYTLFFSFSQYFGKRKLWRLQFYKKKTENNPNGLCRIFLRCFPVCFRTKKGSLFFSGFLGYSFYARRTSNSHHKRYSYSLLGPGTLTAHRRFHLVLLHSCPDTVHGVLLRKTQTSTSLIEGSFAMKKPSDWHHPRCSGLRVQGTAISPAAHCLVYGISQGMSRNFCVEDGRKQRAARRVCGAARCFLTLMNVRWGGLASHCPWRL